MNAYIIQVSLRIIQLKISNEIAPILSTIKNLFQGSVTSNILMNLTVMIIIKDE